MAELRYVRALNQALSDAMAADPSVIVFGEDIAAAGGPFGVTRGLLKLMARTGCATRRSRKPPSSVPPWARR